MSILKLLDFRNYMHKSTEAKPTTWGDMFRFFENQGAVTEAVVKSHLWQPSTAYSVGDVVHSPSLGGYAARCTKAGTSLEAEPTWKKDGSTTDGTVTWAVYRLVLTDMLESLIAPIILKRFPVGTIIESEKNVNPGTYIGGTWELMPAGYVTISAGTYTETQNGKAVAYNFKAGETYGEAAHKLTVGELPTHAMQYPVGGYSGWSTGTAGNGQYVWNFENALNSNGSKYTGTLKQSETNSIGSGNYHNNLQPSKAVYRFRRIS